MTDTAPYRSPEVPDLLESHQDHLLQSGLSIEVIKGRRYRSIMTGKELEPLGFSKIQRCAPGILIPLHGPDGSDAGCQYRPDNPRCNEKGKLIKYENPKGGAVRADMPPQSRKAAGNPEVELWITEGAKKADALTTRGVCALNLIGVWGFKGRNAFGGTTVLADFDLIAWSGRTVYIVYDSDIMTKTPVRKALERLAEHLGRRNAEVCIVNLPPGPGDEKVGVDDYLVAGHNVDDLRQLAAWPPDPADEALALNSPLYCVHEGQFCVIKPVQGIKMKEPLCNFTASISDEVLMDDGLSQSLNFIVEGALCGGQPLPPIDVPAPAFAGMSWVTEKWGTRPVVYAGSGTKDHLRTIMQLTSNRNGLRSRRVFQHTGWREVDGQRFFLTASGALGNEDVEVSLSGGLARYSLPLDLDTVDRVEAVRASLSFLDFGRSEVMNSLWAAMYLAPLSEILEPAFSLWLSGRSGCFKSVLSALALCHFGDFTYLNLPASWRDSANSLERLMAVAKDLPLVVDDFYPASTIAEARELEQKAGIVIRGQGNKAGRGRLRPDASAREKYTPRGMVITSGEQLPNGESITSRLFAIEMEKGDIKIEDLSAAQRQQDLYKYAMAHYILWLKEDWGQQRDYVKGKWLEWRDKATEADAHLRLPGAVAWLYAGFEMAMLFATDVGAIELDEAEERCARAWDSFIVLAARQAWKVDQERPATRFLDAFSTLLAQQRIFMVEKDVDGPGDDVKPGQTFVGWQDEERYYLISTAVYSAVYEYCQRGGSPFTFKPAVVWADLVRLGVSPSRNGHEGWGDRLWVGYGRKGGKTKVAIQIKKSSLLSLSDETSAGLLQ